MIHDSSFTNHEHNVLGIAYMLEHFFVGAILDSARMFASCASDAMKVVLFEGSPTVHLWSDCTPREMHFGRLQPLVSPFARHPWWDKERKLWTTLPLQEFLQRCGRGQQQRATTKGRLEVLASGVEVTYTVARGVGKGQIHGF